MAHRFGKFSIDFILKSGESIVGEIDRQFFRQTMGADNFLLGKKSLVKSTPGLNTFSHLIPSNCRNIQREREEKNPHALFNFVCPLFVVIILSAKM